MKFRSCYETLNRLKSNRAEWSDLECPVSKTHPLSQLFETNAYTTHAFCHRIKLKYDFNIRFPKSTNKENNKIVFQTRRRGTGSAMDVSKNNTV